eukprot:360672-Chlamydomonas_euryale.AAC.13
MAGPMQAGANGWRFCVWGGGVGAVAGKVDCAAHGKARCWSTCGVACCGWAWQRSLVAASLSTSSPVPACACVACANMHARRDKPSRPFRCLDPQYRRELVRVYLTNVEGVCRRFCDDKRARLMWVQDEADSFKDYWLGLSAEKQRKLLFDRGDSILKVGMFMQADARVSMANVDREAYDLGPGRGTAGPQTLPSEQHDRHNCRRSQVRLWEQHSALPALPARKPHQGLRLVRPGAALGAAGEACRLRQGVVVAATQHCSPGAC